MTPEKLIEDLINFVTENSTEMKNNIDIYTKDIILKKLEEIKSRIFRTCEGCKHKKYCINKIQHIIKTFISEDAISWYRNEDISITFCSEWEKKEEVK